MKEPPYSSDVVVSSLHEGQEGVHLRRHARGHSQSTGQGSRVIAISMRRTWRPFEFGHLVLEHVCRGVHEPCVDRPQFRKAEETGTMLGRLELEGCRLEDWRRTRSVICVQFVSMVDHGAWL